MPVCCYPPVSSAYSVLSRSFSFDQRELICEQQRTTEAVGTQTKCVAGTSVAAPGAA